MISMLSKSQIRAHASTQTYGVASRYKKLYEKCDLSTPILRLLDIPMVYGGTSIKHRILRVVVEISGPAGGRGSWERERSH